MGVLLSSGRKVIFLQSRDAASVVALERRQITSQSIMGSQDPGSAHPSVRWAAASLLEGAVTCSSHLRANSTGAVGGGAQQIRSVGVSAPCLLQNSPGEGGSFA